MSRITKWKLEKSKVKVVFRLQFHATNIPQTGWEKLYVSFIPTESGKVTAKTTKANVRNGTCKWGDPIYETTRLLLDAKNKLFDDKLYKLVVGMGSSRSSILGETTINLADYADALKPSAVALPLHGTNTGTILHVTVQLLTSKTGFREFELQRELRETGLPIGSNVNGYDESGTARVSSSEQKFKDQTDKVDTRIRLTKESKLLPSLEEVGESEEYGDSPVGYDGSSNTSGSLYADKHDISSTHEHDSLRSTVFEDLNRQTEKRDPSDHRIFVNGSNEWVQGWSSDCNLDNDLAVDSEENSRLRGSLEAAESSIFELKLELNTLQGHAEEIGFETQKLADQLVVEIASGQELAKEVSLLKSQCSKFKDDFEQLKSKKLSPIFTNMKSDISLPGVISVEGAQPKDREVGLRKSQHLVPGMGFGVDLYEPESFFQYVGLPSLVPPLPESTRDAEAMAGKILELLQQLDEAKVEKETLVRKMDQMECYYESLVQELEENQKQMLGEFHSLRNDHSTCLYTISANKIEMESIRHDMNEQALRFSEERLALDSLNRELERRAIISEAALQRARLNYSIAVTQLQKDLDLLSFQVSSMFETYQNLINDAFSEPTPQKSNADIIMQDQNEIVGVENHLVGGDILADDLKKSLCLQEDVYQKVEVELCEMRSSNLYLHIYSNILKETLLEASTDMNIMKEKIDEYAKELELSNESRSLLVARLQTAVENFHALNEDKAGCIAQCSHLIRQNQMLEGKLESMSNEIFFVTEKLIDCEAQVMDYKGYEAKYEVCFAEKSELENCLELENLERENIEKEMSYLKEEFQTLKDKCDELSISNESSQKLFTFLQDKLGSLLTSYDGIFGEVSLFSSSLGHDLESKDIKGIISDLEERQQNVCEKMVKLIEEKKSVENERDMASLSSSDARSEILAMKQKFKNDVQDMVVKLDISNFMVEKLQSKLESVADKFHIGLETEKKYLQLEEELLAYFPSMELELQTLYSKTDDLDQEILGLGTMGEELGRCQLTIFELMRENENLAQKILGLKIMAEELGGSKLTVSELTQEKQDLVMSLRRETEKSIKLNSEVDRLGEELGGNKLIISELMQEKQDLAREILGLKTIAEELGGNKSTISELEQEKEDLVRSLQSKTEESIKLESEIDRLAEEHGRSKLTISEFTHEKQNLSMSLETKTEESIKLESELHRLTDELGKSKLTVLELVQEKQGLLMSLQSKIEDSTILEFELDSLKESVRCMNDEIHERGFRDKLEGTIANLTSQLAKEQEKLVHFEHQIEEIDNLIFSVEESEVISIVLKAKLDEQNGRLTFLEEQNDELIVLQDECNDLRQKLSEQILKTEEFKNMSINLKELKDKADAEFALVREKRESEGSSLAVRESLRIAFIKEQYEARLQELRQQLSISKRHGEEILLKLQDATDEIENRKKSEASHLQKNEELSIKVLALEAELQSVISEKREKINAYDRIKTELECTILSLECCKEEKEKLNASLQICEEEKSRTKKFDGTSVTVSEGVQEASLIPIGEVEHPAASLSAQSIQLENSNSKGNDGTPEHEFEDKRNLLLDNSKRLTVVNDHFRVQTLRSSMEHLDEELERMKNENSQRSLTKFDPTFQDLHKELLQLQKANQELASICPLFNDLTGTGNALERVLAFEIELAEALRAKKKSSIQFQSSFLKQHSDEEAVFKSFRDINELIRDMLETKGKYTNMETELKEMHDRYSQLSLQFAEVEGERQKLTMTLKNVRASKKQLQLNRSSSATLNQGDHSL